MAKPERPPAVAVTGNAPGVVPAVRKPVLLMLPPPAATDHVGVIGTTLFPASRPTATNCCVPLMASVTSGVTVMLASGPATIVAVADALREPTVAVTANAPRVVPAVRFPVPEITPPPVATDQVGAMETMLSSASRPTATNCCVPLMPRVTFGVTVRLASDPGSTGVCVSHAASMANANTAAIIRLGMLIKLSKRHSSDAIHSVDVCVHRRGSASRSFDQIIPWSETGAISTAVCGIRRTHSKAVVLLDE